jgi:hypothetical protein
MKLISVFVLLRLLRGFLVYGRTIGFSLLFFSFAMYIISLLLHLSVTFAYLWILFSVFLLILWYTLIGLLKRLGL